MKIERLAAKAAKALRAGRCLAAGTAIDDAYYELGRVHGRVTKQRETALLKLIRETDEPFERRCVKRKP